MNENIDKQALLEAFAEVERIIDHNDLETDDCLAASALYAQFCAIGGMLAPAISHHLAREGLAHSPDAHPSKLPETTWGLDTPDAVRRYNAHVLGRLLYDLKPAIGKSFHNPDKAVDLVVRDLNFEAPPNMLPNRDPSKDPKLRKVGAGGRPNRDLRQMARAMMFEVVIFEAARRSVGEAKLCFDLTGFEEFNWKRLAKEQKQVVASLEIRAAGKMALAPHKDLGKMSKHLAELALS